jgi:hypothetical protein
VHDTKNIEKRAAATIKVIIFDNFKILPPIHVFFVGISICIQPFLLIILLQTRLYASVSKDRKH